MVKRVLSFELLGRSALRPYVGNDYDQENEEGACCSALRPYVGGICKAGGACLGHLRARRVWKDDEGRVSGSFMVGAQQGSIVRSHLPKSTRPTYVQADR